MCENNLWETLEGSLLPLCLSQFRRFTLFTEFKSNKYVYILISKYKKRANFHYCRLDFKQQSRTWENISDCSHGILCSFVIILLLLTISGPYYVCAFYLYFVCSVFFLTLQCHRSECLLPVCMWNKQQFFSVLNLSVDFEPCQVLSSLIHKQSGKFNVSLLLWMLAERQKKKKRFASVHIFI